MPYLVETLHGKNAKVTYDKKREELKFQIDVTIGRGEPSDQCPTGFNLETTGQYCHGKVVNPLSTSFNFHGNN